MVSLVENTSSWLHFLSRAVSLSRLPSLDVGASDDIVEALTSSSQPVGDLRRWAPDKMAVGTRVRAGAAQVFPEVSLMFGHFRKGECGARGEGGVTVCTE